MYGILLQDLHKALRKANILQTDCLAEQRGNFFIPEAGNAAFLVGTAPLWTAVLTLLFSRIGKGRFANKLERIRVGWPLIGGTLLALLGMGLMVFDGHRIQLSARGDLLA